MLCSAMTDVLFMLELLSFRVVLKYSRNIFLAQVTFS